MDKIPFNAARYTNETFKVYVLRRWNENKVFEALLKPRLFYSNWTIAKTGKRVGTVIGVPYRNIYNEV